MALKFERFIYYVPNEIAKRWASKVGVEAKLKD